jgi:hypothetical protein
MSSTFLQLDLTEAQRDAISAHTPYRFHTIPVPPPPPAAAAEANHDHLVVEPYLPLPLTTSPPLILTPQRPTDVSRIVETLTDPAVGMQLIGPPWPFKAEDAHSWGESLRAQAEEVFRDLKARTEQLGEISTNENHEERGTERQEGEKATTRKRWPIPAPKIHSLRRADNGAWAGDFGVTRWQFDNVVDPEEKQRLIDENEAKEVFDPTITWTYGCKSQALRVSLPFGCRHLELTYSEIPHLFSQSTCIQNYTAKASCPKSSNRCSRPTLTTTSARTKFAAPPTRAIRPVSRHKNGAALFGSGRSWRM